MKQRHPQSFASVAAVAGHSLRGKVSVSVLTAQNRLPSILSPWDATFANGEGNSYVPVRDAAAKLGRDGVHLAEWPMTAGLIKFED